MQNFLIDVEGRSFRREKIRRQETRNPIKNIQPFENKLRRIKPNKVLLR